MTLRRALAPDFPAAAVAVFIPWAGGDESDRRCRSARSTAVPALFVLVDCCWRHLLAMELGRRRGTGLRLLPAWLQRRRDLKSAADFPICCRWPRTSLRLPVGARRHHHRSPRSPELHRRPGIHDQQSAKKKWRGGRCALIRPLIGKSRHSLAADEPAYGGDAPEPEQRPRPLSQEAGATRFRDRSKAGREGGS
jgi:hypothetical protein